MIPKARNLCALIVTLIEKEIETKQHSGGGVRRGDTRREPSVRGQRAEGRGQRAEGRGQRANCGLKLALAGARRPLSVHC